MNLPLLRRVLTALALACAYALAAAPCVIVLDPGHGGKDAGAVGDHAREKDVVLAVGRRLAAMIEDEIPGAKVVMTRNDDRFVPLQGRADIANKNKADLFISLHANSVDRSSPNRRSVSGASVYTLGLRRTDANLAVAMRENAVMKMEKDYTTTYAGFDPSSAESYIMFDMLQQHNMESSISLAQCVEDQLVSTAGRRRGGVKQAPFWVLVQTSMPAVLVELDFICNPEQERFMTSRDGQERLARAICQGVAKFTKGRKADAKPAKDGEKQEKKQNKKREKKEKKKKGGDAKTEDDANPLIYKVQFLTSPRQLDKKDRRLRGVKKVDYYVEGGSYKYVSGSYKTKDEARQALRDVKERHPDAFVITTRDGRRVR